MQPKPKRSPRPKAQKQLTLIPRQEIDKHRKPGTFQRSLFD